MIISKISLIRESINSLAIFNWTIKDLFLGIFMYKFNGVMWYILYIYIYAILSPLLYKIFSHKKLSFIFLILLIILSGSEKYFFNTYKFVWPLLYYSIGAISAVNYKDLLFKKFNSKINFILLVLFLISVIVSINFKSSSSIVFNVLYTIYRIFPMMLCWYSTDLFIESIANHNYFKAHTFLYFYHFIPIICVHKILSLVIAVNNVNLLIINILSVLIVLISGILINKLLKEKVPFMHNILTGARR